MQPPPQKEQEAGLEALCAAMAWRGFHHASFVRRGLLEEGLAPLPPEATGKPLDCVYFSLVCRDDDYDDDSLLPAWFRWIQANTHALPRYGACDLAFARFRPDTLIPATDPRLGPGGAFVERPRYSESHLDPCYIFWDKVRAAGWCGVDVPDPNATDKLYMAAWEVPTVAVWDARAIEAAVVFPHAAGGAPFRYACETPRRLFGAAAASEEEARQKKKRWPRAIYDAFVRARR